MIIHACLLPLEISSDRDEVLAKITENIVGFFDHEMVVRTKLESEVKKNFEMVMRSSKATSDANQNQVVTLNKITSQILDLMKNTRENWEATQCNVQPNQMSSMQDTQSILAVIIPDIGLKQTVDSLLKALPSSPPFPQLGGRRPQGPGKAPSSIETNTKSASAVSPYPW